MTGFEYKVVPAPMRALKGKGIKGTPARFAYAVETVMNEMGAQGWEYQRADTLPVEERQGLTGKTTTFQHLLVFRRPVELASDIAADVTALIEDQSDLEDHSADDVDEVTAETPSDEPSSLAAVSETQDGEAEKDAR